MSDKDLHEALIKHIQAELSEQDEAPILETMDNTSIIGLYFSDVLHPERGLIPIGASTWIDPRLDAGMSPKQLLDIGGITALACYVFMKQVPQVTSACVDMAFQMAAEIERNEKELH